MFCNNCGANIDDGEQVCSACGTQTQEVCQAAEPVVDSANKELINRAASSALSWGIISLVCAYLTGFLGIIFACIGFSKAKNFKMLNNGVLEGKAKIGRGLSIAGLWLGIALTVFYVLSFLVGFFMGLSGETLDLFGKISYAAISTIQLIF